MAFHNKGEEVQSNWYTKETVIKKYDLKSEYADELLKFLGIMAPDSLEGMMDQQQKNSGNLLRCF